MPNGAAVPIWLALRAQVALALDERNISLYIHTHELKPLRKRLFVEVNVSCSAAEYHGWVCLSANM